MRPVNGRIYIDDTEIDYIAFGRGSIPLVMIPGLGDGLKNAKGMALPFSLAYRKIGSRFRVYAFSRRNRLPEGFTTIDMAKDVAYAMKCLHLKNACVVGVSLGGMIAQHLAIRHPECVGKLVLCVTAPESNDRIKKLIHRWKKLAAQDRYAELVADTSRFAYTDAYYRKSAWMYPIVGRLMKPKSFENYYVQADACLTHNATDQLNGITCPTFVIGGARDRVVTADASRELAKRIPGSKLYLYPEYGHAVHEEAKDFQDRLMRFFAA